MTLMDKSPLLVVVMSVAPRLLVPLLAYLVARLPLRGPKRYGFSAARGWRVLSPTPSFTSG